MGASKGLWSLSHGPPGGNQHFAGPEHHGGSAWVQARVWLGSKTTHSLATILTLLPDPDLWVLVPSAEAYPVQRKGGGLKVYECGWHFPLCEQAAEA